MRVGTTDSRLRGETIMVSEHVCDACGKRFTVYPPVAEPEPDKPETKWTQCGFCLPQEGYEPGARVLDNVVVAEWRAT